jgi:hypothetical protein
MNQLFAGLLTAVVGVLLCFGGLRFFRFLMLVVGFIGGFTLGGLAVAVITKTNFVGNLAGWIVALLAGFVLAGFAYAIYVAGVAVIGGGVGYGVALGVMVALGYDAAAWLTQGVAVGAAVVAIILTFLLNVHRALVIFYTALSGAAIMVAGFLVIDGKLPLDTQRALDGVNYLRGSPVWLLVWAVLALAGIGAQWQMAPRRPKPAAPVPAAVPPTAPPVGPHAVPGPAPTPTEGAAAASTAPVHPAGTGPEPVQPPPTTQPPPPPTPRPPA